VQLIARIISLAKFNFRFFTWWYASGQRYGNRFFCSHFFSSVHVFVDEPRYFLHGFVLRFHDFIF